MKKNIFIIALLTGCCSLSAWAQKQEKTITVEVNNNWNRAKTDEPVVINLHDLHTGFKVKSAVVMEGSTEIPSQLDDLNRDRQDHAQRGRGGAGGGLLRADADSAAGAALRYAAARGPWLYGPG